MESINTVIRPSRESLGQITKLSTIDQIAPRDYVAVHFFFRLPPGTDNLAIFRYLQQGLLTTVQQIPQLMCCICKSDSGRDELELRFCEDSGATMTMRDYTSGRLRSQWHHGNFDLLEREHFPLARLPRDLVLAQTRFPGQECIPALAMQANFIEGGLVLTGCLHHTICDGTGNFIFYTMLGQHVTAAMTGQDPPQASVASVSLLDRSSVAIPDLDVRLDEFPDWKRVGADATFLNPTDFHPEQYPKVQYGTYYISEANLRRLKQVAIAGGAKVSAVESVCAFLWLHTVRARDIDLVAYPEAKLSICVDTRARMDSSRCSPSYWGNLSEPNAVARIPTHLFSKNAKPNSQQLPLDSDHHTATLRNIMSTAASRIKNAIAAVDSTAVRRLVGIINQMSKSTSLTWNVDRWPGPDMLIVCVNSMKFCDIDFGPLLGCSEAFRFTVGDTEGKPDGRCLILPTGRKDGNGVEVMLQYDVDTLQRLKDCEEFREFFEWRN